MILSIGMIVKNEEKYLERCLTALQPILNELDSELIIADTGSTDRTVEIAKKFTNNVYYFEWINDFAAARNFTLDRAQGEWYMFIDADEILQDCLDIINFFKTGEYRQYKSAFYIVRSYSCEGITRDYGDTNTYRLIDRSTGLRFRNAIHERFEEFIQPVRKLNLIADHYGYAFYDKNGVIDSEQAKKKADRNLKLLLNEYEQQRQSGNIDPIIYDQLAESWFMAGNAEEALKYAEKGLENLPKTNIMRIGCYNNKAQLLFSLDRLEEVIKNSDEYFSTKNSVRTEALSTDCYMYAVRVFANYALHNYDKVTSDAILCLNVYRQYKSGKLFKIDALICNFKATSSVIKTVFADLYNSCVALGDYSAAADAAKILPISEFQDDSANFFPYLKMRLDIMEHTNYNALSELYFKLEKPNRKYLVSLIRRQFFLTASPKLLMKKTEPIFKNDVFLTGVFNILMDFTQDRGDSEKVNSFVSKYGVRGNADICCAMMCSGMNISSFITNTDFDPQSFVNEVFQNYGESVGFAELFENYDVSVLTLEALEKAADIYLHVLEYVVGNKLRVSEMFEKYGKIGKLWYDMTDSIDKLPPNVAVGFLANIISDCKNKGDYKGCMSKITELKNKFPVLTSLLDMLTQEYQETFSHQDISHQNQPSDEFAILAAQVKNNIRTMLKNGQIWEAARCLKELRAMCPDDPELNELSFQVITK